jgi:nucleoside-triphosphatase THEP1
LALSTHSHVSQIWLKAAVAGSLWATAEITVGSLLHNLKIPFSGTILAITGIWMLISYLQIWPEKGFVWRAGLICAIMKSLSPSAIIFGPMIGIFAEAFIIWIVVVIFGRNFFSYFLAGGMALSYTLIHKILNYYILYGADIIYIAKTVINETLGFFGITGFSAFHSLMLLMIIYFSTGALTAMLALRARGRTGFISEHNGIRMNTPTFSQGIVNSHSYAPWFIALHVASIVTAFILFNAASPAFAFTFSLLYIGCCLWFYRSILKKLRKPGFWIQMILITFTAALFLGTLKTGHILSQEGLMAGLKLNARACILIFGFASIGNELRNPVVRKFFSGKHTTEMYQALNLAFSALPSLIRLYGGRGQKFRLFRLTATLFSYSNVLLHEFSQEQGILPRVYILSGSRDSGKTTCAGSLHEMLGKKGLKGMGFTAPAIICGSSKTAYNIRLLHNNEERELCSENIQSPLSTVHFGFHENVFDETCAELESLSGYDYVIIDEAGHLEVAGKGWAGLMAKLLRSPKLVHIWVVRDAFVSQITEQFDIKPQIYSVSEKNTEQIADSIVNSVKSMKQHEIL